MLQRRALPMLLLLIGLWLLAGCFAVPVPERASPNNANDRDFRKLVGDAASNRAIHEGASRAHVVDLLGAPAYQTPDHRAVAYTFATERAAWIYPLCFAATTARERNYRLYLEYDDAGRVTRWETAHKDVGYDSFQQVPLTGIDDVLKRFNPGLKPVARPVPK